MYHINAYVHIAAPHGITVSADRMQSLRFRGGKGGAASGEPIVDDTYPERKRGPYDLPHKTLKF